MSMLDAARSMLRTINNASNLGETITYQALTSEMSDRGNQFSATGTLTGTITVVSGSFGFSEDNEGLTTEAILRTSDTEVRLSINDRVQYDGKVWGVITPGEHMPGQFKYTLHTMESTGATPTNRRRI